MSEAQLRLNDRVKSIDISKIGLWSGPIEQVVRKVYEYNTRWPGRVIDSSDGIVSREKLVDACMKYTAAQALLDGLASTEAGLAVRELRPDLDLVAPAPFNFGPLLLTNRPNIDRQEITPYLSCPSEWRQPVYGYYERANDWFEIYSGVMDTSTKVITIYGIRNLHPNHELFCTDMSFHRGDVKIIDITNLQEINLSPYEHLTSTPVMYKKHDWAKIKIKTKSNAIHNFDNIQILGIVAEPLGDHVTG